MAEIVNLQIKAGTTFERTLTLLDDSGTNPVDISGYTFEGRVKENFTTLVPAAVFTIEKLWPHTLGAVVVTMNAATTALLTQRKYVFDIAFTRDTFPSTVDTLLEGYLTVRQTTLV